MLVKLASASLSVYGTSIDDYYRDNPSEDPNSPLYDNPKLYSPNTPVDYRISSSTAPPIDAPIKRNTMAPKRKAPSALVPPAKRRKTNQSTGSRALVPARPLRSALRVGSSRRSLSSPVTEVSMAPIAIGNTVRGFKTLVTISGENARLRGRDYCFSPVGTAAQNSGSQPITGWTMVGGTPLTPAAFVDSTLRQYLQMYNKFRFRSFTAHYVTSSPTTSNGDVMFYYGKSRASPFLIQSSPNLLPFVLSDPNTCIGPQWQNMSASFNCSNEWKSCDYGQDAAISLYADGEIFLLSKTASDSTESPGYVMFDYDIEFKEKSIIPRLLTLPISRCQWTNVALFPPTTTVNNTTYTLIAGATNLDGSISNYPTGTVGGDVYKFIFDKTNSVLGVNSLVVTAPNIQSNASGSFTSVSMTDGFTGYAVFTANSGFNLYANLVDALSGDRPFLASATTTLSGNNFQFWLSFVTTWVGLNNLANF